MRARPETFSGAALRYQQVLTLRVGDSAIVSVAKTMRAPGTLELVLNFKSER